LKGKFIEVFKRKPKTILGLTKVHFILHGTKVLKKYHLIALIIPFMAAVLGLNLLPVYVEWGVFMVSSGYLVFLVLRRLKRKKSQTERRSIDVKSNNPNRQSGTRPRSVLQQ
jgi:membrane protein implicated in regulation of membrane protease activity